MKICLIGNMNNNFFSIKKILESIGFDVDLYCFFSEPKHFSPKEDTYDARHLESIYFFGMKDDPIYPKFYFNSSKDWQDEIRQKFGGYDILIGCGYSPMMLKRVGLVLDIFIPYGSDLYDLPYLFKGGRQKARFFKLYDQLIKKMSFFPIGFRSFLEKLMAKVFKEYNLYLLSFYQRQGISEAKALFLYGSSSFLDVVRDLKYGGDLRDVAMPMIPKNYISKDLSQEGLEFFDFFQRLRNDNHLIIFHHSRHSWASAENYYSQKRNDILINGYAKFLKEENGKIFSSKLVCFEYGPDVESSKKLAISLGIEENIVWMPKMSRKELILGIQFCDIGAVEFGQTWLTGGALFEFLSQGKPVMQRFDPAELVEAAGEIFPHFAVNDSEAVCETLNRWIEDRDGFESAGRLGQEWYERNVVDRFVSEIHAYILRKMT